MMERNVVVLSERLRSLADMVTPGNRVADVGCDHGFVSIYLVQKGISPRVLAMDVRTGPLSRAQAHVAEYGLSDYIETRLSDGLMEYQQGEADTLVCAGMGGKLMQKILERQEEKSKSFQELILQPQSELFEFRRFLREHGYTIIFENILCEEGKYYFLMKALPCERNVRDDSAPDGVVLSDNLFSQEICDKYGRQLLHEKHPVLKAFLEERKQILTKIREGLECQDKERAKERLQEVMQELCEINRVMEAMN